MIVGIVNNKKQTLDEMTIYEINPTCDKILIRYKSGKYESFDKLTIE